jgi:hypothetical protein
VGFSELVASTEWVTLTHQGEEIAEAWIMPEGDSSTVVFIIPRTRFHVTGTSPPLTTEILLEAAGITNDQVESWRLGDGSESGTDGTDPGLSSPLPTPPEGDDQLTVYVRLKPPARAGGDEGGVPEIPLETWQALEALWKAILALEASIDSARLSADGLRGEMESAFRRSLNVDEKNHALQADVSQWTKAKSRLHHAIPKAREFVHRATWSLAVPERKRLEEVVRNHIEPRIPFPGVDRVREQLEHLQKDRQVLFAQGNTVSQDCRGLLDKTQRAVRALQQNAADRARQKRSEGRKKGKFF